MPQVHQAKRPLFKRWIEDPLLGLLLGLICGLMWILPLPAARRMGCGIGRLCGLCAWRRNKIALKNMSVGLPDKTKAEHREILKKMWCHFGMMFAEIAHEKEVLKKAKCKNFDWLRTARKTGKGGFICTAHFGNWEFDIAPLVGTDFRLNPVYRKANNPWLNALLFERRSGVKIPKGRAGARLMLETLEQGDFIAILCDQKLREGMEIPFFDKTAMTATAMAALAIKKQVPVFMMNSIRQPNNTYTISVVQKLEAPKGLPYQEALRTMMTQVNSIYWDWIKENPDQYLWIHRRFDKSFYE